MSKMEQESKQQDKPQNNDQLCLTVDNIYVCLKCECHLSARQYRVSKQFTGKYGIGYLVSKAFNLHHGPAQEVILMTGKHTTAEARCVGCDSYVGWKYIDAQNPTNFYKINKYVLEKGALKKIEYYKQD